MRGKRDVGERGVGSLGGEKRELSLRLLKRGGLLTIGWVVWNFEDEEARRGHRKSRICGWPAGPAESKENPNVGEGRKGISLEKAETPLHCRKELNMTRRRIEPAG